MPKLALFAAAVALAAPAAEAARPGATAATLAAEHAPAAPPVLSGHFVAHVHERLTSNGTYEEGGDYWLWLDMAGNRWRRDDPVGDDNMTTVTHLNDLIQWQVAPGGDCKAIKLNPGASQPAPAVDANAVPNGTAAAFDGTVGQVWDAPRGAKPPLRAEGMAWIVGDNAKSGWTAPPMLQSACTIHYPACPHGTAQQYACVEVGTRDFSKGLAPTYDDAAVFAKPDGCPDKPTVTKELADVQRGRFGGDLAGW